MAHEGDQPDKQTGGSASQLLPGESWRLSLPSRLAPVTLVFRLRGSKQEELHNARGAHFAVPVGMVAGEASMLGAWAVHRLVNCTLSSFNMRPCLCIGVCAHITASSLPWFKFGVGSSPISRMPLSDHSLMCTGPALMEASEDGKTCAMNFAVRSRFATSMSLVLARQQSGEAAGSLRIGCRQWNPRRRSPSQCASISCCRMGQTAPAPMQLLASSVEQRVCGMTAGWQAGQV